MPPRRRQAAPKPPAAAALNNGEQQHEQHWLDDGAHALAAAELALLFPAFRREIDAQLSRIDEEGTVAVVLLLLLRAAREAAAVEKRRETGNESETVFKKRSAHCVVQSASTFSHAELQKKQEHYPKNIHSRQAR